MSVEPNTCPHARRAASDFFNRRLAEVDPAIAAVLARELERQQRTPEMIASENLVPQAVLDARARCSRTSTHVDQAAGESVSAAQASVGEPCRSLPDP